MRRTHHSARADLSWAVFAGLSALLVAKFVLPLPSRGLQANHERATDAPILPELLSQIPADQHIDTVSADGASDTRACHTGIAARNACAVIPSRKNARHWLENTHGAKARNETVRSTRRLGRAIWRRWSGYHRRSLLETKMRGFKLLGERVMARDFDRQVAELQIRAAILNRFTPLGTLQTQRVGCVRSTEEKARPEFDLCNRAG